jgi:hypothetical protein
VWKELTVLAAGQLTMPTAPPWFGFTHHLGTLRSKACSAHYSLQPIALLKSRYRASSLLFQLHCGTYCSPQVKMSSTQQKLEVHSFSGSQQHLFDMEQKSASLMHKRSASLMCNERTSDNVTNTHPHTIHKSQLLKIWPQNTKHQSQRTWSKPQITKTW